jgi:hypothetical protein
MNQKKGNTRGLLQGIFLASLIVLTMCAVIPSEGVVNDVIIRYFEAKNYRVVELHIGNIESVSLSEKTYMGTRGYTIEVQSITLETAGGSEALLKNDKEQRITFKKASIRMREDPGQKGGWIIINISGIPVV